MIRVLQSLSPASRRLALLLALPPTMLVVALLTLAGLDLARAIDVERAQTIMATDASGREQRADKVRYHAPTAGMAAADFQKQVQDVLAQNRMTVSRIDLPANGDDASVLRISVTANGSLASLRRALYKLETSSPLVFVQALQIERNGSDTAAPLAIQLTLQAEARVAP
jgi:hypothetical protein